jgi:hypothetical protein
MTSTKGMAGRPSHRRPTRVLQEAGRILSQLAAHGRPTTYSALARQLGLPRVTANWPEHPLCRLFATLDAEDIALRRPLRTVVVVNKATGRPGTGFYRTLARAGNPDLSTDADRESAYRAELQAACDHYAFAPRTMTKPCSSQRLRAEHPDPEESIAINNLDAAPLRWTGGPAKFTLDAERRDHPVASRAATHRREAESEAA